MKYLPLPPRHPRAFTFLTLQPLFRHNRRPLEREDREPLPPRHLEEDEACQGRDFPARGYGELGIECLDYAGCYEDESDDDIGGIERFASDAADFDKLVDSGDGGVEFDNGEGPDVEGPGYAYGVM